MSKEPVNKSAKAAGTQEGAKPAQKTGKTRDDRLKSALKANMAKRKSQARARSVVNDQEN
ncbi:hypothetical protein AB9F26_09640 [Falsihalocynthiibacter sp. BN13B15]|uniref:hypothetical protein n=1 Tax=Falsihalocynthiibacter sp. BN13B15 TaxID=3240871 RepID=UPI00350F5D64